MRANKKTSSTVPLSGSIAKKKKKSLPPKTSTARLAKKSKHKVKGSRAKISKSTKPEAGPGPLVGKSTSAAQAQQTPARKRTKKSSSVGRKIKESTKAEKGPGTPVRKFKNRKQEPRTPVRNETKQSSSPSTPSTFALHSTSSSKRVLQKMNDLQIKKKPRKTRRFQDEASRLNPSDPATIDWLNDGEVHDALVYHGQCHPELESFDLHEKIVLLCNCYQPKDIRPVFQGICQDAGWNWRTLHIAKHKTMRKLALEFAKSCVDIVNARTKPSVPGNIAFLEENQNQQANA